MELKGNDPLDPYRLSLSNGIHQGEFFIGPHLPPVNATPVQNILEHLAKREGSDEFVCLKVLTVTSDGDTLEDRQGKVLLHNEHLILSLLQDQLGVVHHHGLYRDRDRFVLVLDCLVSHDYDPGCRYRDLVNLQHYVIREKRLRERESLELFCNVLTTIKALHQKNIIHRDIKLGNMVLNTRSKSVTLVNFALSKHLVREGDMLSDQRGSLAYVSPDILSGQSYCGKSSDMWAMGVLLYTMLYGQFPFYDNNPQELFKKIKTADYTIPDDGHVSMATEMLIRRLIEVDVSCRLNASQSLEMVYSLLSRLSPLALAEPGAQIVPDVEHHRSLSDCMVPDSEEEEEGEGGDSLSRRQTEMANLASNADLNAPRLSLSPLLLAESHQGPRIFSPSHSQHSGRGENGGLLYGSSPPGRLIPCVVMEIPPMQLAAHALSSSGAQHSLRGVAGGQSSSHSWNGNPFLSASPPSSLSFSSSSPSASLNPAHLNSLHIQPGSPSHSYPAPGLLCHRTPLTLSLSSESYFTTSSSPGSSPLSSLASSHSHSPSLPPPPPHPTPSSLTFSQAATPLYHPEGVATSPMGQSVVVSGQNVMESLVTVNTRSRTMVHGTGSGRHSFSDIELLNPNLFQTAAHQRRRRSASGSDLRQRRSSHGNPPSNPLGPVVDTTSSLPSRRPRRRSYDVRDQQAENVRAQATRRLSGSQTNSPYVSIRVFRPTSPDVNNRVIQPPSQ